MLVTNLIVLEFDNSQSKFCIFRELNVLPIHQRITVGGNNKRCGLTTSGGKVKGHRPASICRLFLNYLETVIFFLYLRNKKAL